MSKQRIQLRVGPEDAGARLDQWLYLRLSTLSAAPLSKAAVRKLIVAGAVYLNGRRVRIASKPLVVGARIEVIIDFNRLDEKSASHPKTDWAIEEGWVAYEDDALIVFDKPAGLPTQPTLDEARANLFHLAKRWLAARSGSDYLGLHHRLDRDTSGLILFTKKKEANAGVAKLFAERKIQKTYEALAQVPSPEYQSPEAKRLLAGEPVEIQNFLLKDSRSKPSRMRAVRSGGQPAHTTLRLIDALDGRIARIEATLHTGRMHQIRVHLAGIGLPILGDHLYGDFGKAPRMLLHARSLTFIHPINRTEVTVQSPAPEDFQKCLAQFGKKVRF